MIIFNPTDEVVRCQHGGMWTNFKPGEKKDIFDSYAAKHILNRWGKNGLVELNFTEKEALKFDDLEEYEHNQKIAGITRQLQALEETLYNFEVYDEACGDKKTVERRHHAQSAKELKKKIEIVKLKLEQLEQLDVHKSPQQKAEILIQKAKAMEAEARALIKESRGNDTAKSA